MDWTTIISILLSSGSIAGLFFFRENKRAKQLQNETTALTHWKNLCDELKAEGTTKDNKIDSLYKERDYWRDKASDLKAQKRVLTLYKCESLECSRRKPPFAVQLKEIVKKVNKNDKRTEK